MDELSQATQNNRVWMADTMYYRKYIYDPEQTREEERLENEEREREEQVEMSKRKQEEDILETKETSANTGSNLNNSILQLLRNYDR